MLSTEKSAAPSAHRKIPGNILIVVDVQKDFCPPSDTYPEPGLPVAGGDEVAAKIHNYIVEHVDNYKLIIATKCWHPSDREGFDHFSDTPDFKDTWPPHCVAGTPGADFHDSLAAFEFSSMRSTHAVQETAIGPVIEFDKVFYKGQRGAAYSAFESFDGGTPLDERTVRELGHDPFALNEFLKRQRITHIDVCGIATDYCILQTALDARKLSYHTTLLLDLCVGVAQDSSEQAVKTMEGAGITIDRS